MDKKTKKIVSTYHNQKLEDLPVFSAERLKRLRKSIYQTQSACSFYTRVNPATWRNWEAGRSWMPEVAWAYFILIVYRPIRKDLENKFPQFKKLESLSKREA